MYLLRKNKLKLRGSLMSLYLIIYGTGRAWIEGLRMDSLYIGSIRTSQLLSILLIIFGIGFIIFSYILHKKGKIKSLAELQPYYQANLATKNDKKPKRTKRNKNNEQQVIIDMSGVNSPQNSEKNEDERNNSEEQTIDISNKNNESDIKDNDITENDNINTTNDGDKNKELSKESNPEVSEFRKNETLETIKDNEISNQAENKGKKNKK